MADSDKQTEIIYIADPMCSWCWGFAPVVDQIVAEFGDAASFRIIMGGLRPGPRAQKMDNDLRAYISSHWRHVQKATGQAFNFEFFNRSEFLYDTEPPARAVVTVRQFAPENELTFFTSLQRAFYADNVDITDENNYHSLLQECGVDPADFYDSWTSELAKRVTAEDFTEAQRLGIRGFPSIVLMKKAQSNLLTRGYQPYENLQPHIARFIENQS